MKTIRCFCPLFALVTMLCASAPSLSAGEIKKGTFPEGAADAIPYQLFVPDNPDNAPLPLVLCFHGAAGRGNDNAARGIHAFEVLSSPEVQKEYPPPISWPRSARHLTNG